jgi:gliding motility-associated lipoprotein GldH
MRRNRSFTESLHSVIGALVIVPMLVGCIDRPMFTDMKNLPDRVWQVNDPAVFEVEVTDTVSFFDFYLNIRIGEEYGFANMYLFIDTRFPDGRGVRDTVECILADRSGRWLGDGSGSVRDNRILFKPRVRFPQTGTYTFELEQGMRTIVLDEVHDIGIGIHPSKRK